MGHALTEELEVPTRTTGRSEKMFALSFGCRSVVVAASLSGTTAEAAVEAVGVIQYTGLAVAELDSFAAAAGLDLDSRCAVAEVGLHQSR